MQFSPYSKIRKEVRKLISKFIISTGHPESVKNIAPTAMSLINFPSAKPAIITKVNVTAAHEVGERNIGSKLIHYETPTGTIETVEGFEPAFKANIVFGADWITYDPDGKHARIDLASIATTEDGGSIDYRYTGVITITEDVAKIFNMTPDAKTVPFGFSQVAFQNKQASNTMAPNKILLILGAGPNVAASTAKHFASNGYKVALMSRHGQAANPSYLNIQADLARPESVKEVFAAVVKEYGNSPNVVVHNAYSVHQTSAGPLSLSQEKFEYDFAVNTTSAYLAAQEAVKGFATLPADWPKSFIYTANGLNVKPMPQLVSLGLGKTAMAHVLETCVLAYKTKGWTFYYGDERFDNGQFVAGAISGEAHAARYWELSQDRVQHEWMDTFVAGIGYKKFQ
ncbi:hypothetical protein B7494_g4681 [Chlorociboria aeruginascens]|nr:hypothetical protein B7494_g4681 [Chlorociboria aeruginascens]